MKSHTAESERTTKIGKIVPIPHPQYLQVPESQRPNETQHPSEKQLKEDRQNKLKSM